MPVRRALYAGIAATLAAAIAVAFAITMLVLAAAGILPGSSAGSEPAVQAQPTATRSRPTLPPPSPTAVPATATPAPPPPPPQQSVDTSPPVEVEVNPPPAQPPTEEPAPPAGVEWLDPDFGAQVLALVNGERARQGLAALSTDGTLQGAAQSYSQTLTELHILSHDAGGDLSTRAHAAGYTNNSWLGEVLWMGGGAVSPSTAVQGWMDSPAHHDIILDSRYSVAGVGCYVWESGSQHEVRCVLMVAG